MDAWKNHSLSLGDREIGHGDLWPLEELCALWEQIYLRERRAETSKCRLFFQSLFGKHLFPLNWNQWRGSKKLEFTALQLNSQER